ncbi:hypothetical protein F5Y19DRAFT_476291 [Xylariaceae sp. FL1651]|nr:hypothetical protein F5Y19DRAFT_476291 [Xylariaceae sp. FL1651]
MSGGAVTLKFPPEMLRKLEVEPFWPEFETRITDLFSASDNCRVGVFENLSSHQSTRQHTCDIAQSHKKDPSIRLISSLEELNTVLRQTSSHPSSRVFFLYRYNSWSRMDISIEMFQALYTTTHITPQFLKIVMGLGRKMSSRDESFMSCYTHQTSQKRLRQREQEADRGPILGKSGESGHSNQEDDKLTPPVVGICYNIRHFECHGRSLEDPWSCRQSAIHHNYNTDEDWSDWIIIQPPLRFTRNFGNECLSGSNHPMELHLHYLSTGVAGWREYLNYLSNNLKALNEEIVISKPYREYRIGFSSRQKVHALRLKLHHARSILVNTLNIIVTIRTHEETTADLRKLPQRVHQDFQRELDNIVSELQNHEQTVQELLSVASDTGLMYDGVLKYHGQELLHDNSLRLTQIAQNDAYETRTMAALANKTFQDSRTVKIATVIAMFYLPANLVTSFFSTTFVWFDNSGHDFTLRIRQEAWIAGLTTLVLVVGTKFLSWWWERNEKKKQYINSINQGATN